MLMKTHVEKMSETGLAIMLLKTYVEKMSLLGAAIISVKTNGLFHSCHHIYEKIGLS